jgi:hypothetical protein
VALVWTLGMVEILVPVGWADQVPNPPLGIEPKEAALADSIMLSPSSPVPLLIPGELSVRFSPFAVVFTIFI